MLPYEDDTDDYEGEYDNCCTHGICYDEECEDCEEEDEEETLP